MIINKPGIYLRVFFFLLAAFAINEAASAMDNYAPEPSAEHNPYNENTLLKVTQAFLKNVSSLSSPLRGEIYNIIEEKHSLRNYNDWVRNPSDNRETMSYVDNYIAAAPKILSALSFPKSPLEINLTSFKDKATVEITTTDSPLAEVKAFYNDRNSAGSKPKKATNVRVILRLPEASMYFIAEHGITKWLGDPSHLQGAQVVSIHFLP